MPQVMTVMGPIGADQLGITMCHVHLLWYAAAVPYPEEVSRIDIANRPISMEMLGTIRRNYMLVREVLSLADVDTAIEEVMRYKQFGGQTIVECSVHGMGRDPIGLKRISGATGINVVCGTGWHISARHTDIAKRGTAEEIESLMVSEIERGIGDTGVKAGFIKIACSSADPKDAFAGNEETVLRAAARAQARTGVALTVHPAHHYGRAKTYDAYIDLLRNQGANLERCYMSHADFWASDVDYLKSIVDRGMTIGFDQYGNEFYASPGVSYETDKNRTNAVVQLLKGGYAAQVMLSNEVAWKTRLCKYGGNGYGYVLEYVLQDLRYFGVSEAQIKQMLVINPARILPH